LLKWVSVSGNDCKSKLLEFHDAYQKLMNKNLSRELSEQLLDIKYGEGIGNSQSTDIYPFKAQDYFSADSPLFELGL